MNCRSLSCAKVRIFCKPGGALQERGLGLAGPVLRHGPELAARLRDQLSPWADGHQVVGL